MLKCPDLALGNLRPPPSDLRPLEKCGKCIVRPLGGGPHNFRPGGISIVRPLLRYHIEIVYLKLVQHKQKKIMHNASEDKMHPYTHSCLAS